MLHYIMRRLLYGIIVLFLMTIVSFVIIQLPPGDYLTTYIAQLSRSGQVVDKAQALSLRKQYGLDQPVYIQYFKWMREMLHGNFGMSFAWNKPVTELIAERLPLTIMISFLTLSFLYAMGIAIGIYSATHQYSVGDYTFTVIGFAGLDIPNFLFALVLMFIFYKYFDFNAAGLFSKQYLLQEAWSLGKFVDMLKHLLLAMIVVGTAGTAWLIRIMRGCLLDELGKQYVITARAKGVEERTLLFKYPVRVAINPIVSTIGWELSYVISGQAITSIVLGLPTVGPLLYSALLNQDMYLAGSVIVVLCSLTVIGTVISDILLAWIDPRIRFENKRD